jgi:hypothetical protein
MAVAQWRPRAVTTEELELVRSNEQSSELFLSIIDPVTIYTARVNQTFSTKDRVVQVTFDGGSGTLADVKPGMTMYIGTSAGAYDAGQVRIRKTPIAGTFYIGETSDVLWADDLYLTVVDEFGLWARHINIASNVPYMDWDIAYSNQHTNTNPIPILGPRLVPVWVDEVTGEVTVNFDSSLSYTLDDTSVSGVVWSFPGASATSGLTTSTPTATYDAPGLYRAACVVTAANGLTTTGYVYVYVYSEASPPITQFDIKGAITGSFSEGAWKFNATLYAQAGLSTVRSRAMVCLFAKDYYNGEEISIGQIPDRENIIAIGWINGESIVEDPDGGSVDFSVEGAVNWMKRMSGFPIGIQNATTASSAWTNWFNLTVDKSLYHLLFWQSTVIPCIDVFLTGDEKTSQQQYAPGDSTVFDQVGYLLKNTLLGVAGSDMYNRLMCFIDPQITPPDDRDFETIIDLEKVDWRDQMPITRTEVNVTSMVNLTGVAINLPEAPFPVFSLAPGHAPTPWGRVVRQDRMLLSSQAQGNQLAAMKLAWDNHNLEFSPDLAGNNRMLDVFPPYQYVGVTVDEADTPREFVYAGNCIVREINISFERNQGEDIGFLQVSWRMEQETFPGNSSNGDAPESDVPTSGFPPTPPPPPIPSIPPIAVAPPDPTLIKNFQVLVEGVGLFYTNNGGQNWYSMNSGIPDPTQISAFEISATGKCFCQVALEAIYAATYPGAPWTKVFDVTQVENPGSFPFPRDPKIVAFGINRDADDELLIAAGLVVTIFPTFLLYNYKGDSSGVSLVTPTHYNDGAQAAGLSAGNITFGDGKWVVSYLSDTAPGQYTITSFDQAADSPLNTEIGSGFGSVSTRSRYAPSTVCGFSPISTDITQDNGDSLEIGLPPLPPFAACQSIISDSEGMRILIGVDDIVGLRRSADGGTTWGLTSAVGVVTSVWNLGSSDDWLFAYVGQLLYTPDFGNTFVYITGDLQTWAGAFCKIVLIRHL